MRYGTYRWCEQVLEWMTPSRRKRGRPRVRRRKGVQDPVAEKELEGQRKTVTGSRKLTWR
jgi:hypothetical protein